MAALLVYNEFMAARQYYYTEELTEASTTSSSYSDKETLTFTPDDNSDYLILATSLYRKTQSAGSALPSVALRESTTVFCEGDQLRSFSNKAGIGFMDIRSYGASPGSKNINLSVKVSGGVSPTAYVDDMRIVAIKLDSADKFATTDTESSDAEGASADYDTICTLTFTPATQGDYLIIAYAELQPSSGGLAYGKLVNGANSYGEGIVGNPAGGSVYVPWFTMVKLNLAASSQTFTIQDKGGNFSTHYHRNMRIVAIRLSNFEATQYNESRGRSTNTTTTYSTKASINFTPNNVNHLVLSALLVDNDTSIGTTVNSLTDGTTVFNEQTFEPFTSATEKMSQMQLYVAVLAASSTTFVNQFKRGSNTTAAQEAAIAILQLEVASTAYVETYTETVTQTDSLIKTPGKLLSSTLTHTDAFIRGIYKVVSVSITNTDTLKKVPSRSITENMTNTDYLYKLPERKFTETITDSDTLKKSQNRSFSIESVSLVNILSKSSIRSFAESFSNTDNLYAAIVGRMFSDVINFSDYINSVVNRIFTEITTLISTFLGQLTAVRELVESITTTAIGAMSKTFYFNPIEIFTYYDYLYKNTLKNMVESSSISDNYSFDSGRLFTENVTIEDLLFKILPSILFDEEIGISDYLLNMGIKNLVELINYTDNLYTMLTIRIFTELIFVTSSLSNVTARLYSESIAITEVLIKTIIRSISDIFEFTDYLYKTAGKVINNTFSLTSSFDLRINKVLVETITAVQQFLRTILKNAPETITISIVLEKLTGRYLDLESTETTDYVVKRPNKNLTSGTAISDVVNKTPGRSLSDQSVVTALFNSSIGRHLSEIVTLIDSVLNLISKKFTESILHNDVLKIDYHKFLSEVINHVDSFTTTLFRIYSEYLTITGNLFKSVFRLVSLEVTTYEDLLVKRPIKTFNEIISVIETFLRSIFTIHVEVNNITDSVFKNVVVKPFVETISFIGLFISSVSKEFSELFAFEDDLIKVKSQVSEEIINLIDVAKAFIGIRVFREYITVTEDLLYDITERVARIKVYLTQVARKAISNTAYKRVELKNDIPKAILRQR